VSFSKTRLTNEFKEPRTKNRSNPGLAGLTIGILTMLKTPTVILPPWILVLLFLPILLGVSFLLGLGTKYLIKSSWTKLTFTTLFAGLFCIVFYISEYKPTHKILLPTRFLDR
jgi:predicted ABC-type sugar transport system permease subunit